MHDPKLAELFEREGKAPPSHQPHGTDEEIAKNMKRLLPTTWRMAGNQLIGQTEMGELVQHVPTNLILTGVDDKGLPIFKKIA